MVKVKVTLTHATRKRLVFVVQMVKVVVNELLCMTNQTVKVTLTHATRKRLVFVVQMVKAVVNELLCVKQILFQPNGESESNPDTCNQEKTSICSANGESCC